MLTEGIGEEGSEEDAREAMMGSGEGCLDFDQDLRLARLGFDWDIRRMPKLWVLHARSCALRHLVPQNKVNSMRIGITNQIMFYS